MATRSGLRLGVYWSPKGSGIDSAISETISSALRLDYLAVPVIFAYAPRPQHCWSPLLLGGMEYAYLVKAHWFKNDMNSGESESDITSNLRRWDVAPVLAIGISGPMGLEFEVRHTWGVRELGRGWTYARTRSLWAIATVWFDSM